MSDNNDTAAAETAPEAPVSGDADAVLLKLLDGLGERVALPEGDFDIVDHALASIDALKDEVAGLQAERDALQAAAAKVAGAPKTSAGKAGAGRKVSAKLVKDPIATDEGLLAAIMAAGSVEVAFSDGANELAGIVPLVVEGRAWAITQAGVQLKIDPLIVHGPAPGHKPHQLRGYGLFLDGKLAAYRDRGELLEIGGGTNMNLGQDILFAA